MNTLKRILILYKNSPDPAETARSLRVWLGVRGVEAEILPADVELMLLPEEERKDPEARRKALNSCDIAFLDVEMAGMSGVELAETLKRYNSEINIVFCTGYGNYRDAAFELHASGYLMKPITPEKIKHLRHIIVSHHGSREFGAISLPATAEAYAVHAIDLIDSRIYIYNAEADKIAPGELSDRVMMLDGVNVWKPDVE